MSDAESNARYQEYRQRERKRDTAMMAKRLFVLQVGHTKGMCLGASDPHVTFKNLADTCLAAADAFMQAAQEFEEKT